MHSLIFATHNPHKVLEISQVLPTWLKIISLDDAGFTEEIPEPFDTLEANAAQKSKVIAALTAFDVFAEDTGLEVAALGGAPGVRSARYAGENRSSADNTAKLLAALNGTSNRLAQFRTVISLRWKGNHQLFQGICRGSIALQPAGEGGFGYDPVFIPEGENRTFAQMTASEKNAISHRAKAVNQMAAFFAQMQIV